jgi:hypothetical protein
MNYKRHHKKIEVTANQRIVLDFQGYILESDDGIFDTSSYRDHTFLLYSPFLESVFSAVLQLQFGSDVLFYPRVETLLDGVTGVYDCHFRRISCDRNQPEFEWLIDDLTHSFEPIRQAQQERNEDCIQQDLYQNSQDRMRRDLHRRR